MIVLTRSLLRANSFSQTIANMETGRAYSLKMYVCDYDEFSSGSSVNATHHFSISIQGGDVWSDSAAGSITERYNTGEAGHNHGPFNRTNVLWITFARRIFTATAKIGRLSITDWESKTQAGGPQGQKLMFNFVQLAPYLAP